MHLAYANLNDTPPNVTFFFSPFTPFFFSFLPQKDLHFVSDYCWRLFWILRIQRCASIVHEEKKNVMLKWRITPPGNWPPVVVSITKDTSEKKKKKGRGNLLTLRKYVWDLSRRRARYLPRKKKIKWRKLSQKIERTFKINLKKKL